MPTTPQPPLQDRWTTLVRHILLGTDQLPPDASLQAYQRQLGIAEDDANAQLLEAVGITQLLAKGGQPLPTVAAPAAFIEPEGLSPCSPQSMQFLQAMLDGHHAEALPEFVALLRQHRQTLPPESLPTLFDRCIQQPALWEPVSMVMGQRGTWLASQHPLWSKRLIAATDAAGWRDAPADQQWPYLCQYRRTDPTAARQSLAAAWPHLDAKVAARLLKALEIGLGAEDEPFLETCLQEKQKPVRLVAADLLAHLPDSQLVNRLWKHAQGMMRYEQEKMTWTLPDTPPAATLADGIVPTGSKLPGGLPLNWWRQLLGRIPLYFWERHWSVSATDWIASATNHRESLLLQSAFAESLVRYPHPPAATALYKWWLLAGQATYWDNATAKQLLAQATDEQFNACLLSWLEKFGPFVPPDSLAAWWLAEGQHVWSPAVSKLVVFGFRDAVQAFRASDWQMLHYRRILSAAAYRSDPALLDVFKNGWSFRGPAARWQSDVEKLLHTLHFRREMRRGLG